MQQYMTFNCATSNSLFVVLSSYSIASFLVFFGVSRISPFRQLSFYSIKGLEEMLGICCVIIHALKKTFLRFKTQTYRRRLFEGNILPFGR
jgi:hypothetical protein